jgi:hypothetical protein
MYTRRGLLVDRYPVRGKSDPNIACRDGLPDIELGTRAGNTGPDRPNSVGLAAVVGEIPELVLCYKCTDRHHRARVYTDL